KIQIEGSVALELAENTVLPVVVEEFRATLDALKAARESGVEAGVGALIQAAEKIGGGLDALQARITELAAIELSLSNCQEYNAAVKSLRNAVDYLETIIDDRKWPLPKYREMLFIY
ncbi:MAG: glutamine synthetase type III, partial [Thermoguttaceae bacterium]|nr:glutamine synthetase type III [Thermoguttaceae bacterium]